MEVVPVGEEALPVAPVEQLPVPGGLAVEVLCAASRLAVSSGGAPCSLGDFGLQAYEDNEKYSLQLNKRFECTFVRTGEEGLETVQVGLW